MRRGKPAASVHDEDFPCYAKPGAKTDSGGKDSTAKEIPCTGIGPVELFPAISDAGGPALHSFAFEWLKGEEEERRQQMIAAAKEDLRAYLEAQARAAAPTEKSATPARRPPIKKLPEAVLENVRMVTYDLWTNNQPVIVFSADAHAAPPRAGSSAVPEDTQYSILLVAYPDIYNNLHKLYSAVTDPRHLDVNPRLELIDAVDAAGDGIGELLFRQTTDLGSGWIIYRATADKLWKMFDSLNPE